MQAMPTDIGLARHQAFPAALLILGSGLALYQMTSLMLGPAGSRQLALSLSIPTVETRDLAPAASDSVIGNLVVQVSLRSGSTVMPAHRTSSRSAVAPPTTSVAPVADSPSVGKVPPVVAPSVQPERQHRPVVTVPRPERDGVEDDETD